MIDKILMLLKMLLDKSSDHRIWYLYDFRIMIYALTIQHYYKNTGFNQTSFLSLSYNTHMHRYICAVCAFFRVDLQRQGVTTLIRTSHFAFCLSVCLSVCRSVHRRNANNNGFSCLSRASVSHRANTPLFRYLGSCEPRGQEGRPTTPF